MRKSTKTLGMKRFPFVPAQDEFDWLAKYIDSKNDPLYSLVFGYQMIDSILRVLIVKRSGDTKLADAREIKRLIEIFKDKYPERSAFVTRLYAWKERRDAVIHSLLFDHRISDPEKLSSHIRSVATEGEILYEDLHAILKVENQKQREG